MRQGRTCKVEGCCIVTDKYGILPSLASNENDTRYPSFLYNWLYTLIYFPLFVYLTLQGIVFHVLGRPKRAGWDLFTSTTVSLLRALRDAYSDGSLVFWRCVLSLPKQMTQRRGWYSSPFKTKKLGLKGILAECDALEDGKRIINAEWVTHDKSEEKSSKVALCFHGGGFCVKDWSSYLQIPTKLVKYTNRNVFSVSYRLSPETRFPGALYDAVQAYFHLIDDYQIDPKDITFVGDSAGGGLIMSLLLYLRDHGYPLPETSIHISPWLDISHEHPSWTEAKEVDYIPTKPHNDNLNPALFYVGASQYHQLKYHPYVSPLYANHYNDLPPILIQSGGSEVMKSEIDCFMRKHGDCNTFIKHEEYKDMVHDFQMFDFPQSHLAFVNIQKWFQQDLQECQLNKK